MAAKKVFLLGPGYVGREIIDLLLAEGNYQVTTIVRREAAGEELRADGIKTVLGDLDNHDLIKSLAKDNDIVFHTATADHLSSAQAILDGITERAAEGLSTIYLHQSGASVLSDGGADKLGEKIYSDDRPQDLDALPDNAPHRPIDLALIKTRKQLGEHAKIFIMMPPVIYGTNKKYGRLSIQVPTLARFAIKNRYSGYVGSGKMAWGVIHVQDVASAYITILHWLEKSPPTVGLEHPYFFCESGEKSWYEIAAIIGDKLHKAGKVNDATPRQVPPEQYVDLFGKYTPDVVGNNARNRADRLRALGWKPAHGSLDDVIEQEELPLLLQEKEFVRSGLALA